MTDILKAIFENRPHERGAKAKLIHLVFFSVYYRVLGCLRDLRGYFKSFWQFRTTHDSVRSIIFSYCFRNQYESTSCIRIRRPELTAASCASPSSSVSVSLLSSDWLRIQRSNLPSAQYITFFMGWVGRMNCFHISCKMAT